MKIRQTFVAIGLGLALFTPVGASSETSAIEEIASEASIADYIGAETEIETKTDKDIETISFEEYQRLLSELGDDASISPYPGMPAADYLPENGDLEDSIAEEEPEPLPEPEPDMFAAAPFSAISLKDLESHLNAAEALHQEIDDYYKLACAYAAAASDDRYFRRSCEFHARAAVKATPEIAASISLLTNFVMIAVIHFDQQLKQIVAITDPHEWAQPDKRAAEFARLALLLEACYQHLQSLQQLHNNIESYIARSEAALKRVVVAGKLPELLATRNRQILALITRMNETLASMNRRIKRALEQSSNVLDYLCNTNDSLTIATSARQLLILRRNFNELALAFRNFNKSFTEILEQKTRMHKQYWQTLEEQALKHDKNIHHLIAFLNNYPARDLHHSTSVLFNTASVYLPMIELMNQTLADGDEEQTELFANLIEEIDQTFSW